MTAAGSVRAPTLIAGIADTARWVAVYRAMESERPDALFHDPFARRLAGAHGEAIVTALPQGRQIAWAIIVRTCVIDEIITRLVAHGVDTVLNLAAGLDTRAWRMTLPPSLHWIDVDQEVMVTYKANAMAGESPVCRYESRVVDLADADARKALFRSVDAGATRTLVITEGLLLYLPEAAVREFAIDVHAMETATNWLTDLASPALITMMERSWGTAELAANAPFLFGPAEGPAWFLPFGWQEQEYRPFLDEGLRLNRAFRFARFFHWLGRLAPQKVRDARKYFSGVLLLERRAAT